MNIVAQTCAIIQGSYHMPLESIVTSRWHHLWDPTSLRLVESTAARFRYRAYSLIKETIHENR